MVATEILILAATALFALYYFSTKLPKNFPPGPRPYPIVGNLTQIVRPPFTFFMKLQETYGDIIGLHFGSQPVVVLNNHKHIREAFSNNVFSGRPQTEAGKQRCLGGNRGVLFAEGHVWFSHDDPRLNQLIKALTDAITDRPLTQTLAQYFPFFQWLRNTFPTIFPSKSKTFFEGTYGLIGEIIKQHEDSLQEDSPRDFIDIYLNEINKTNDSNSTFYKEEGHLQLKVLLLDMFAAGAETTSTTLTYSFLFMALHPEVQEKLFEEINRVVGNSRNVSLSDRPEMPYTEACILEIQRFASLVPLAPHHTHEDVEFQGFTIPKGTNVVANLYSACRDKKAWGDPDNFRPERFLSGDGKTVLRNEAFIPFSIGKRVCLGESLAKDELFLFLTNLFQAFKVKTVDGEPKPKVEAYYSIVLVPKPHRVVLVDRQAS
ncbi:unnamed protein product [Allacma fusca]|uniref:Cytochrome P450 n=1 Tax=Allacma fusca TaxID=39272 RepID=A0A8J2L2J6_9HEXA|nr:unnamed protein product [Allacma fusca]